MTEEDRQPIKEYKTSDFMKTWLIRSGVLFFVFLVGFVPMLVYNWQLSGEVADKERDLRRSRILNTLSAATIYARRGEYETARQNTSTFFTDVRTEMDRSSSLFSVQERVGLDRVMVERDEIITLLSRNDPAASERLSNVFIEYVGVVPNK